MGEVQERKALSTGVADWWFTVPLLKPMSKLLGLIFDCSDRFRRLLAKLLDEGWRLINGTF